MANNKIYVVKNDDGLYVKNGAYHRKAPFTDDIMLARQYRSLGAIKNSRDCGRFTKEYRQWVEDGRNMTYEQRRERGRYCGKKKKIADDLTPVRVELRLVEVEEA